MSINLSPFGVLDFSGITVFVDCYVLSIRVSVHCQLMTSFHSSGSNLISLEYIIYLLVGKLITGSYFFCCRQRDVKKSTTSAWSKSCSSARLWCVVFVWFHMIPILQITPVIIWECLLRTHRF